MNIEIQIPTATDRTFFIEISDDDYSGHSIGQKVYKEGTQFEYKILADFLNDEDIEGFAKAFAYAAEQLNK
jgi:hypothetical protein